MEKNEKIVKVEQNNKNVAVMERHKIVILEGPPGIGRFIEEALEKIQPKKFIYLHLGIFKVIRFLALVAKRIKVGSIDRAIAFLLARSELGKIALHYSSKTNVLMLRYFASIELMEEIMNPENLETIRGIINRESDIRERNLPESVYQYVFVDIEYKDKSEFDIDFIKFERLRERYKEIAKAKNWSVVSGEELAVFLKAFFGEE